MRIFILSALLTLSSSLNAQQTVGLFHYSQDAFPGYTLFAPGRTEKTYLIDNCGDLQFIWESAFRVGNSVDLMENGTLIRACDWQNGSPIDAGGAGGRIEAIQMDQQIAWSFEYSGDTVRLHHDFERMPNGNLLMIAWELKTEQQAIDQGRDPSIVGGSGLWPDHIIEYDPTTDQIVWTWRAWDHLIQDFDNTKPNFGVVEDHPELFNLNFDKGNGAADWQHLNSVAYNESLDQIALCSPAWNEVYIIDHSTTTEEAASHTGGNSGKGGDILWRWGNPEMYGAGDSTDRQLYGQHDAHWIPEGYRHENEIIIYNNGKERSPVEFSSVEIVAPSILPSGEYEMVNDQYLPAAPSYTYMDQNPADFYSRIISSADMLPNGNIIICEGTSGHYFEVDSLDNLVWDYVNPVVEDSILEQEEVIPGGSNLFNLTFRARRIAHDYAGVEVLPLVNMGPIELNPYTSTCVTQIGLDELSDVDVVVYPSPVSNYLNVTGVEMGTSYKIYSSIGEVMHIGIVSHEPIDVAELSAGIYFLELISSNSSTVRFVKQ